MHSVLTYIHIYYWIQRTKYFNLLSQGGADVLWWIFNVFQHNRRKHSLLKQGSEYRCKAKSCIRTFQNNIEKNKRETGTSTNTSGSKIHSVIDAKPPTKGILQTKNDLKQLSKLT